MDTTNINLNLTLNLAMLGQIVVFINQQLFDMNLFNEIVNSILNDIEKKKLKILFDIISNNNLKINPTTFSNSFGAIINSFICILQSLFAKINLDDFNNKLVDWLETGNKNEQEYLLSANITKTLHKLVTGFNNRSKYGFYVYCTTMLLKNINGEEDLMIKCHFKDE